MLALLSAAAPVLAQDAQPTAADVPSPEVAQPSAAQAAQRPKQKPWQAWLDREPPPDFVPKPKPEPVWYGWQTLLLDGLSFTAGVVTAPFGGWIVGFGVLIVGTPIVHFIHGNIAYGLISLAIRAVAGGLFFAAVLEAHGDSDTSQELAMLSGVTIATAVVLDAAAFSWVVEVPDEQTSLAPFFDPVHGHAGLRYAGTF